MTINNRKIHSFLWNYLEKSDNSYTILKKYDDKKCYNVTDHNGVNIPIINFNIFFRKTLTMTKQDKETTDED